MSIDPNEIKTAVEVLDKADTASWQADGLPTVEAVRRLTGNETVAAEDIAAALKPVAAKVETKASTDTVAPPKAAVVQAAPPLNTQPPAVKNLSAEAPKPGDAADPDADKVEVIGNADDERVMLIKAKADELAAVKAGLEPKIYAMQRARAELDADLKAAELERDKVAEEMTALTADISQADMVRRIQKQTQERLMKQHEDQQKINAVLRTNGVKTFPSALDQALSAGAKRSVVLVDGKPFQAPHPRSPEGIRSYANWVHHGAGQPA